MGQTAHLEWREGNWHRLLIENGEKVRGTDCSLRMEIR